MLYIEDFLELIEPFPQEIRERLTEMRETDLQIQNETDKLDERIKTFFHQCKKQKTDWKNQSYEEIRGEYSKLLENADDKVQISNQLYELIEKYLKKLDQELQKFKLELEADHAGITSKLEQVISSQGMPNENSPNNIDNGNFLLNSGTSSYNFNSDQNSDFTLNNSTTNELMKIISNTTQNLETNLNNFNNKSLTNSQKRKNSHLKQEDDESNSSWNSKLEGSSSYQLSNPNNPTFHFSNSNTKSAIVYNKKNSNLNQKTGQISNSSSLNKLIRSNNMSLNQQTTSKQRTPSNKSNKANLSTKSEKSQRSIKKTKLIDLDYDDDELKYDYFDVNQSLKGHEGGMRFDNPNNDLYTDDLNEETSETTGTSENDLAQMGRLLNNDDDFETDSTSESNELDNIVNSNLMDNNEDTTSNSDTLDNKLGKINNKRNQLNRHFKEDWNSGEENTNERYCICKDISYGDMIMCDNSKCGTQWFHFVCVGLNAAPKGKWFCPFCVDSKKKKKEKQLIGSSSSTGGPTTTLHNTSSSLLSTINKVGSNQTDLNIQNNQASSGTSSFLSASSSFTTHFK